MSSTAVLLGIALGVGLWSVLMSLPRLRRPRLADRVAPAVLDVSPAAAEHLARRRVDPLPVIGALLGPFGDLLRRLSMSLLGGTDAIARRLRSAGLPLSVEEFRGRQLVFSVCGFVAGILFLVAIAPVRPVPVPIQVVLPPVVAVAAFVVRDWMLQRTSSARRRRIADEFPTVLEFLSLCLSAGEGIHDALERVGRTGRGEFAAELAEVTERTRIGIPLTTALRELDERLGVAAISRCTDAIVTAMEHGSPLAEVLRAQAQDARDESKRTLMEVAGRKEIAMMVPLVFLILPVTVLFAIYPGVFVLKAGF